MQINARISGQIVMFTILTAAASVEFAAAQGEVRVRAGTANVDLNDSDDGFNPLSVSVGGSAGGATYSASASASAAGEDVKLRVHAFAEAPPVIDTNTFLYAASAEASAEWYDVLTVTGIDLLPPPYNTLVNGISITTNPHVDGTISGPYYTYHLHASAILVQDEHFDSAGFSTTQRVVASDLTEDQTTGTLPLILFGTPASTFESFQIEYLISIDVKVTSHPGPAPFGGPAEADYSHTVSVGPFIITDANGNYIPGSENLRIVGSSGFVYSVKAVPESFSFVLAGCGTVIAGAYVLRQKWRSTRLDHSA